GLLGPLDEARLQRAKETAQELVKRAAADLRREGVAPGDGVIHVLLDLRYQRQSFDLTVPAHKLADEGVAPGELCPELSSAFHQAHEKAYGYANPGERIELVAVRVRAEGRVKRSVPPLMGQRSGRLVPDQALMTRFDGVRIRTPVYRRERLTAGASIPGPAILVEPHATTVIPPHDTAWVTPTGALLIESASRE